MCGKVVLVTGATGYLGRQMCFGLAEAGATVLVNSRNFDRASALVLELESKGYIAQIAHFDVSKNEQIETFFDNYNKPLNVIINNAYSGKGGTIECSTADDFSLAYDVIVGSANNLFQRCLPLLKKSLLLFVTPCK